MNFRAIMAVVLLIISNNTHLLGASNWYIDNSLTGSANNGTSWADAWTNFSSVKFRNGCAGIDVSANAVHAGDTIYISGGETSQVYYYTNCGYFCIGGVLPGDSYTGTTTIEISQESGHNGVAIFDGAGQDFNGTAYFLIGTGSNVVVSGNCNGSTNFVFRNIISTGSRTSGDAISINAYHVTLEYFIITNACNGISSGAGATDVEIRDGSFLHILRDSAISIGSIGSWDAFRIHHCYFSTCVNDDTNAIPYGTLYGGPDVISDGSPITIHDCIITHELTVDANCWSTTPPINGTDMQHPDDFQGVANYTKVYNNVLHAPPGAVFEQQPPNDGYLHDIIIADNLIVNDQPLFGVARIYESGYVTPLYAISNIFWLNNTIMDFPGGIGQAWQQVVVAGQTNQPTLLNWVVYNNIAVSNCPSTSWMALGNYANLNFSTNLVLTAANVAIGSSKMGYGTRTMLYIQNPLQVYWTPPGTTARLPSFISYHYRSAGNDFHLKSGDAVARGKGLNLTDLFATLGIPATDLDGNARPVSDNWDIGAYQSTNQSTVQITFPDAPTLLHTLTKP
jgi:hypothetical protein